MEWTEKWSSHFSLKKVQWTVNSCKEIKFKVGMKSVRERFTDI